MPDTDPVQSVPSILSNWDRETERETDRQTERQRAEERKKMTNVCATSRMANRWVQISTFSMRRMEDHRVRNNEKNMN